MRDSSSRYMQTIRKMTPGTLGGQSRVATPVANMFQVSDVMSVPAVSPAPELPDSPYSINIVAPQTFASQSSVTSDHILLNKSSETQTGFGVEYVPIAEPIPELHFDPLSHGIEIPNGLLLSNLWGEVVMSTAPDVMTTIDDEEYHSVTLQLVAWYPGVGGWEVGLILTEWNDGTNTIRVKDPAFTPFTVPFTLWVTAHLYNLSGAPITLVDGRVEVHYIV